MESKMSDSEFKDQPIQLIDLKEDGTLEISEQALDFLSALSNQKISILSINGPQGQGKSLLANTFIDQIKFKCSGGTRGIWMWGTPIELDNKSKLIIIDTQGIKKDDPASLKIGILSLLLSTCFIYNTNNEIDDTTIELFSMLTDMANKIGIDSEESSGENHLDLLGEFFPQLIWTIRDYKNEKDANIYLEEKLNSNAKGANIKKLFQRRQCYYIPSPTDSEEKNANLEKEGMSVLSAEFKQICIDLYNGIKKSIKVKKINNFDIDGESLFGILQNYVDSINNDENPVILKAMENDLLSKGKKISEKCLENFKTEFNKKLEGKMLINPEEIYQTFFELMDQETKNFSQQVTGTLTVKQAGDFLVEMYGNMRLELSTVFETNKENYGEWFDMEYKEMEKILLNQSITKIDDLKDFFAKYLTEFKTELNKFAEIPNSDFNKTLTNVLIKIVSDFIVTKFTVLSENLTESHMNYLKDNALIIDNLNTKIKSLNDQIASEKKNFETKLNQTNELNREHLELESKFDKLTREMKAKEKEYENNISIEVQKFQKMESYYLNQIKDKDAVNSSLESKIEKANKDIVEVSKENVNKISELNRENMKLHVEIERLKGQGNKGGQNSMDGKSGVNLQQLFKGIQSTFLEFKESVDKLDRENENVFKTKYLELSTKEIESKSKNWIDEIRLYREDQLKALNENYEKTLKKVRDEVEELNFELTKKNYSLNEQTQINDTYKDKIKEVNTKLEEVTQLSDSKENVIKTQNDNIQLLEKRLTDIQRNKEDLELKLNKYIVDFKMQEDELENVIIVIDSIFAKKKDRFEHALQKLNAETRNQIVQRAKTSKFFK